MDTTHQRERRRRYTLEFKRRVVEETLTGRESVSVVARRHDLNANLVFNWRRRYEHGALSEAADSPTALLPIRVTVTPGEEALAKRPNGIAELELLLASGHRVRVHGAVDPAVLRVALEVLWCQRAASIFPMILPSCVPSCSRAVLRWRRAKRS